MKKFIKNLKMFLPREEIFYAIVLGMGIMLMIHSFTMIITDSRIVNKYEYQKLQQHCTAADSLVNSIDTDYVLDVLSEMSIYDEYIETK